MTSSGREHVPKRPRSHAISTESYRALLAAMPDSWTVEERRNDYGVDLDVEIFRDGLSTGLHFGIQLKSTESVGRKASVRVKRSTANYWSSLEYPVLIVLYESAQRRIWWQWWHRDDPYGRDTSAARFTLTFPGSQLWDSSITPDQIALEVLAYRSWADADSHLPLSVIIRWEGQFTGLTVGSIIVAVRRRIKEFEGDLELRASPAGPLALTIEIRPNESVIWVSGGGSATLHHQGLDDSTFGGDDVAVRFSADLTLLIADRLAVLGLWKPAARLLLPPCARVQ